MSYEVILSETAKKNLAALDTVVRRRVLKAVYALAEAPMPSGAIHLQGVKGQLRIRVGDYRVIYSVDGGQLVVLVLRVGHRRDVYER